MSKFADIAKGYAKDAGGAAGAAAGTAIAPGIGTAVGAVAGKAIGEVVRGLFGGGASRWANAGPDVHGYITNGNKDKGGEDWNGGQQVLDWLTANHPDMFATLDQVRAGRMLYEWEVNGSIFHPSTNPYHFPGGTIDGWRRFYEGLGIDPVATVAKITNDPRGWRGRVRFENPTPIVMKPGQGTAAVPRVVVDKVAEVADKVNAGVPLTRGEQGIAKAAGSDDAGPFSMGNVILLAIAALIVWAALRD